MSNDIARLPKWAQKEIALLRSELELTKKQRDDLRTKNFDGSGSVSINNHGIGSNFILQDKARVKFSFGSGWQNYIEVRHDGDAVEVSGGDHLSIYPRVANVIRVKVEKI